MSSSYENNPSSSHSQQTSSQNQHKSPHPTLAVHSEDLHVSGRHRVRAELSSPRHQHTPTGWLGPYNDQSPLIPSASIRSPRVPRLPGSHPSHSSLDREAGEHGYDVNSSDIHRASSSVSNTNTMATSSPSLATAAATGIFEGRRREVGAGEGLERREFDPKHHNDARFPGSSIEPSSSIQSLVESIDDDHVYKLTEMTKKRVEHNNPAQKRQRVVSLPITYTALATNFQPSEKTLQLSSSCKSYLESRYTQLYQSINVGQPINRLRKLHEILPQINPASIPKSAHDTKLSRRLTKIDKYRFVDKVQESSCIWDVDRMEEKFKATASTVSTKQTSEPNSRQASQQDLLQTEHALSIEAKHQTLSSTSTDSFGTIDKASSTDPQGRAKVITNRPYHDSPLSTVVIDAQPVSIGLSPSSTSSSINNTNHTVDSTTNSSSSLDPLPHPTSRREGSGESKLRNVEPTASTLKHFEGDQQQHIIQGRSHSEASSSKRNSFLGIFGVRGKKVGQDIDQLVHHESPQHPSYGGSGHRLTTTEERRSMESQDNPYISSAHGSNSTQRGHASSDAIVSPNISSNHAVTLDSHAKRGASLEEALPTIETISARNSIFMDDDNGGHYTPPSQWPQGERIDESQDESDNVATANNKRSSLRRIKDKMLWKRGHKTLSAIQQGEIAQITSQGSNQQQLQQRFSSFTTDSSKSLGKKFDPTLAHLHEKSIMRIPASEPSSGRNSIEGSRPKTTNRVLSSNSSPNLEAVKGLEGAGTNSPRVGPSTAQQTSVYRTGTRTSIINPSWNDNNSSNNNNNNNINNGIDGSNNNNSNSNSNSNSINVSTSNSNNNSNASPTVHPMGHLESRSPMINPSKTTKSPMMVPSSSFIEDMAANGAGVETAKPIVYILDTDRIPKRLLEKLKLRPELTNMDWSADTVDLSAMWTSSEPPPTYEEYVGIPKELKSSPQYPHHLDDIDVLEIHLMLGVEESEDVDSKQRGRRWDMLESRVDNELDQGEKWIKDIDNWSKKRANAIQRYTRSANEGSWQLYEDSVLVQEPEEEEEGGEKAEEEEGVESGIVADGSALDRTVKRMVRVSGAEGIEEEGNGTNTGLQRGPTEISSMIHNARKQQRNLSLLRDMGGSMSSLSTSVPYSFRNSITSTREAMNEMSVYLVECRQRLKQLHEATGDQLVRKEAEFKFVVDKFTKEWNESYFMNLKDVEEQIQVMNLKRIENPWMDMLLIMLSWVIRGLFYIVEGVTIIIIIMRHTWDKAKKGFQAVRDTKQERERVRLHDPVVNTSTNKQGEQRK